MVWYELRPDIISKLSRNSIDKKRSLFTLSKIGLKLIAKNFLKSVLLYSIEVESALPDGSDLLVILLS
jgi:hypothetical protein